MPSTREIRRRIRSVSNMSQITRAMEMVSAAKMRKAQQRVTASRPYSDELREIMVDVVADARRAHDIIQSVRNAIKKGATIRAPLNLNEVVNNVMHMVQPDAVAHSCRVEVSLANHLPPIEADPTQIQQVLINLLTNAFDAMEDAPSDRRSVQIATEYDGNGTVCVRVRDHGPGIPDSARKRLFEQFFTTKHDGLGMGLAIVRSVVEAHGGKVRAENVDGGGADFCIHLPASNGEQG